MINEVEAEIVGRQYIGMVPGAVVNTVWHYSTEDPLAVEVEFNGGEDNVVPWTFGRDLVIEALQRGDAGSLDVVVRSIGDQVSVRLSSPSGTGIFRFDRDDIETFIDATLDACAQGEEDVAAAVEEFIARIHAEGSDDWWL